MPPFDFEALARAAVEDTPPAEDSTKDADSAKKAAMARVTVALSTAISKEGAFLDSADIIFMTLTFVLASIEVGAKPGARFNLGLSAAGYILSRCSDE